MPEEKLAKITSTRRPIPGASKSEEQLLAIVTELTGQLAITRERLDTLERLVDQAGVVDRADIESFAAGADAAQERHGIRYRLISRVFRPLRDTAEHDAAKARQNAAMENPDND